MLTQGGINDVIQNNTVVGVGPMDNDTVPNPNASEVILTEAYRLQFEGKPSAISPDGRIVQISNHSGGPGAAPATSLAILSGPQAGQWRLIAQVIDPTTYLLDAPHHSRRHRHLDPQAGFVNETFEGNTIDTRGSSTATTSSWPGTTSAPRCSTITCSGGARAFVIDAYPTESPDIWGWSHCPVLGRRDRGQHDRGLGPGWHPRRRSGPGRQVEPGPGLPLGDPERQHRRLVGRVPGAAREGGAEGHPLALTVGDPLSADPAELLLTALGNQVQPPPNVVPGKTLQVNAGVVNGQVMVNQGVVLPTVPVLTATALGQDGVDLVGNGLSSAHPDGAQDVDILLAGLPTSQAVRYDRRDGLSGGGEWQFNAQNGPRPHGSDAAALVRTAARPPPTSTSNPTWNESGRNYQVTIFYDNGSSSRDLHQPRFRRCPPPDALGDRVRVRTAWTWWVTVSTPPTPTAPRMSISAWPACPRPQTRPHIDGMGSGGGEWQFNAQSDPGPTAPTVRRPEIAARSTRCRPTPTAVVLSAGDGSGPTGLVVHLPRKWPTRWRPCASAGFREIGHTRSEGELRTSLSVVGHGIPPRPAP